jgi:hypothetical protein
MFVKKMVFGGYTDLTWEQMVIDLSFSPQTVNSLHVITSNRDLPFIAIPEMSPSRAYKYIGPDINECWEGHFRDTDPSGNPQWQDITPNYSTFSSIGGTAVNITNAIDKGKVAFIAVETSPWNKDLIYVACNIDYSLTSANRGVKVMTYNGAIWRDYSLGIPPEELVVSMVMDHNSNDGLYLATDKAVYYRDKTSTTGWVLYNNNLPIIHTRQMEINYQENTVRVGTYGRGIFKSPLMCPLLPNLPLSIEPPAFYEAGNITASGLASMAAIPTVFRGTNSVVFNPGFSATASSTPNAYLLAFIHGCTLGSSTTPSMFRNSSPTDILNKKIKESQKNDITLYPNPNGGIFTLVKNSEEDATIQVYDINGKIVYQSVTKEEKTELNLSHLETGIYMLQLLNTNTINNLKISIIK